MMRSIFVAIVLALHTTPWSLEAQQIGAVSLPLGWERQVVLQRLAKHYDVDSTGVVRARKGPRSEILGSVRFEGGRLTLVSRNWDVLRGGSDRALDAAVSALSQLEGDLACRIQSQHTSSPDEEVKAVQVICGAHSVSVVTRAHKADPLRSTVSEVWRVRAFTDGPQRPRSTPGS